MVTLGRVKPTVPIIMRPGKTERDHASGAWARRQGNHDARKVWDRQTTATSRSARKSDAFPIEVCNGKKTRAIVAANKRRPYKDRNNALRAASLHQQSGIGQASGRRA